MKSQLNNIFLKYLRFLSFTLLIVFICSHISAQTDTEFWFAVPELSHRGSTGGTPGVLQIATYEIGSTVTVEMPLNPAFTVITRYIPANSADAIDLSAYIDLPPTSTPNQMENKALNASGINNFGLHITSTSLISVYWEIGYTQGADLWVLKGSNALGTLFYTPFQTEAANDISISPRPYSSIDVVALTSNTQVTFTTPPGVFASYGAPLTSFTGSYTVTLNRGQTFSLFPNNYSETTANRLAGTKIEASAPIAVSVKDDAITASGGRDVVGEQLVPISNLGSQYIAFSNGANNRLYIVASQPTSVNIIDYAGVPITGSPFVFSFEGEQKSIILPSYGYFRIASADNSKFYVLNVCPENKARGGAILPAISSCTGNTEVSFSRSRNDSAEKFTLYLLVEKGNENDFWLYNSLYPAGIPLSAAIPSLSFTEVNGTDTGNGNWMAYYTGGSISAAQLAIGQNRIVNRSGVFHMGILNGYPSAGRLYYGYYSDYGNLKAGAFASSGVATASQVIRTCHGIPVSLYAYGGTSYTWTGPTAYLNNPSIQNPVASGLAPGAYSYHVLISGDCGSTSVDITILVSSEITSSFQTNVNEGTTPFNVTIEDLSINAYTWQYDFGDGSPVTCYDLNSFTQFPSPPNPFTINHTYNNSTNETIEYTITLLAKNEDGCEDSYSRNITVYPASQTFTVTFTVADGFGNALNDALVTFNGVQNEPGQYIFTNITPNTYNYSVSHGCSPTVEGQVTVIQSDVNVEVNLESFPGDANGDISVNVTDLAVMVGNILGTYTGSFCFYNADVIVDNTINIQDVIATANIILSGKTVLFKTSGSTNADIYLSNNGIRLISDGTIAGLQIELTNVMQQALLLTTQLQNQQLSYIQNDDKIIALIYSMVNTPIPAGEVELISFQDIETLPEWGNVLAANNSADLISIQKHIVEPTYILTQTGITNINVFPNPANETLNVSFLNSSFKDVKITLNNIDGQPIMSFDSKGKKQIEVVFDINFLPKGVYVVNIESDGQTVNRIVIIQ